MHHVDLGLDYRADAWDDQFVARFLPDVLASLGERADPKRLLAWGFGRSAPPVLEAWG